MVLHGVAFDDRRVDRDAESRLPSVVGRQPAATEAQLDRASILTGRQDVLKQQMGAKETFKKSHRIEAPRKGKRNGRVCAKRRCDFIDHYSIYYNCNFKCIRNDGRRRNPNID